MAAPDPFLASGLADHTRDLVVIGGSAGSRWPMQTIVGGLSADFPAAVLIVGHLAQNGHNWLPAALQHLGGLPVSVARDGEQLRRGQAYLASPGRHLMVRDGHVLLGTGAPESMARPSVDALFRSAAISHGSRAVAVLLSGMLADGAAGLDAIRRCGGVTMVQHPDNTAYGGMVQSALEASPIDHCLPAGAIPGALSRLFATPPGPRVAIPADLRLEDAFAAGPKVDGKALGRAWDDGGREADDGSLDLALVTALHITQQRLRILRRMMAEARGSHAALCQSYERRVRECEAQVRVIRTGLAKLGQARLPGGSRTPAQGGHMTAARPR
jgi:hypothetical protein